MTSSSSALQIADFIPSFIALKNEFLAKWLKLSASNQQFAGLSQRAISIVPNLDIQCFFSFFLQSLA